MCLMGENEISVGYRYHYGGNRRYRALPAIPPRIHPLLLVGVITGAAPFSRSS